jgi:DNA polymerase-1
MTVAALAALSAVPTIAYCVDEDEAHRLVDEVLVDAGDGPVAVDFETAPSPAEVDRLTALRTECATVGGRLKAAKKLGAPDGELKAEAKRLRAAIAYAATAGLDPHRARVRLMQLYGGGRRVAVIDLDRVGAKILRRLEDMRIVAHNAAFELSFLQLAGVEPYETHCTMQASRLTLGEGKASLKDAAAAYLGVELDKTEQTSDWGAPCLSQAQVAYAARDAVVTWRVAQKVARALGEQAPAYTIQIRVTPAVARMQLRGFRLDVAEHDRLMADLARERAEAAEGYRGACTEGGCPQLARAVPSTPQEKADLLRTLLTSDELARWARTRKTGALSTSRSNLLRAAHYPPIAALVRLASLDKMLTAFGPTLAARVSPVTGRIHAHYHVAGTASGRASCSGPNLQQVPRDPRFRALFKPDPGNVLVAADYATMELRAAAHISGDAIMMEAFEKGLDLHRITAARITGAAPEEVTDEDRQHAKAVNFGACYGLGARGLVQSAWEKYNIVITENEAARWLEAFAAAYPRFARWRREHAGRCESRRRIVMGRDAAKGVGRLYPLSRLPAGSSAYTRSCNFPVQGACADASMLALAYVDDRLFEAGIDGGPVAWLHDEIVLEVREDQAERATEILKQAMIDGFAETFPGAPLNGLVEPHVGMSWGEAK